MQSSLDGSAPSTGPAGEHSSDALIDTFIDALWLEEGLARNSLAAYRRDLGLYAAWLKANYWDEARLVREVKKALDL